MSPIALTVTIFGIMLVLMAVRTPISIAMFAAGAVGYQLKDCEPADLLAAAEALQHRL
jgi:DNA-binding NarL/FixJ family response regulator